MQNTVEVDIVDVLVSRKDLSLPAKDFDERIIEPMIARLRARWKNWDGDHTMAFLRVTAQPVSQAAWDRIVEGDKDV
jgi:hypothetical protein